MRDKGRRLLLNQCCVLIEQRKHSVSLSGRHHEDRALDSRALKYLDRGRVGIRIEDRYRNRLGITPRSLGPLMQGRDLLRNVWHTVSDRHPSVTELNHPVKSSGTVATHQYRWVRLLHGLRVRPDLIEVYELTVEFCFIFRPDLLHREHPLTQHTPARFVLRSVILHLLGVPSAADAKDEAPS